MTPAQAQASAIARLAGLADVVGALLAVMPMIEPDNRTEALRTCASMTAELADEINAVLDRV